MDQSLHGSTVTKWTLEVHEQTRRERTDPTVKWLLNERAALAGRMAQLDDKLKGLHAQLAGAERRAKAFATKVSENRRMRQDAVTDLKALDTVMSTSFPTLNPAAGGVVRPWAGKYGELGGLKRFVLSLLERASPASITTGDLARIAAAHFQLQLSSNRERIAFRKQVRRLLRTEPHRVEELPAQNIRSALGWRWRGVPSLTSLYQEAAREAAHSFGPEVGCQRDGRGDGQH